MLTTGFHQKGNDHKTYNQRINQDEVEAGSILVALANHKPKSMSIHNLLGKENRKKKNSQEKTNIFIFTRYRNRTQSKKK